MTTALLNTTAHLVARALRARRTVIWQYRLHASSGSWRFHGLSRSLILKDVRQTLLTTPDDFRFGLEYEPSLDLSKLPNPLGYSLGAYTHILPPPPPPPPLTTEQRNANAQRLHIDRIEAACYALDDLNPALAAKIRLALQTVTHPDAV
jgi:hypothetical protein